MALDIDESLKETWNLMMKGVDLAWDFDNHDGLKRRYDNLDHRQSQSHRSFETCLMDVLEEWQEKIFLEESIQKQKKEKAAGQQSKFGTAGGEKGCLKKRLEHSLT